MLKLNKTILFLFIAAVVFGCAMLQSPPAKLTPLGAGGDLFLGAPVTHANLAVFPICARKAKDTVDYLTLDEGMKEKLVEITEKKNAQVSELCIHNKSDKPLYLLGGEIIVGGKQDRIVAQNTIVPPKTEMGLGTFCVERGRWSARNRQVIVSGRPGGSEGASGKSAQPKFHSLYALAKTGQRSRAQIDKDQSGNWQEVALTAGALSCQTSTSTLRAVYDSKEVQKKVKIFIDALNPGLEKVGNLVGFVVVINGEVRSCDIFRSPKLFRKLKDKLLNSYVVETLSSGKKIEKEVSKAEVLGWLTEAREKSKSKVLTEASDSYGKRKIVETDSPSAKGIKCYFRKLEVHANYFKK